MFTHNIFFLLLIRLHQRQMPFFGLTAMTTRKTSAPDLTPEKHRLLLHSPLLGEKAMPFMVPRSLRYNGLFPDGPC